MHQKKKRNASSAFPPRAYLAHALDEAGRVPDALRRLDVHHRLVVVRLRRAPAPEGRLQRADRRDRLGVKLGAVLRGDAHAPDAEEALALVVAKLDLGLAGEVVRHQLEEEHAVRVADRPQHLAAVRGLLLVVAARRCALPRQHIVLPVHPPQQLEKLGLLRGIALRPHDHHLPRRPPPSSSRSALLLFRLLLPWPFVTLVLHRSGGGVLWRCLLSRIIIIILVLLVFVNHQLV